ncbi:hypothetical protein CARUB_v10003633mg, partial [Capsella rubella]
NIHGSVACKSWREADVYVRVGEKYPWLICFPRRGKLFEHHDPFHWKLCTLSLTEIAVSTVCYSRDGWLIWINLRRLVNLDKLSLEDLFFFNPFTRELITLPQCELAFKNIVSCPSTLDNCVVVEIRFQEYFVTFTTCHLGEIKWVTKE